ncbi:MAG: DUF4175 domain-containing protein [Rhizomicrobium sp.]
MTTTSDAITSPPGSPPSAPPGSVSRAIALARAVVAWERVWPALWPALGIVGLYLGLALFGAVDRVPGSWRGLVQAFVLACAGLAAMESLRGLRWPTWLEGARRVERVSALAHRPISEHNDRLAAGVGDASAETLWRLHLKLLLARIGKLRVGRPRVSLKSRDPRALRYVLLIILVSGAVVAGRDWSRRLEAALTPGSTAGGPAAAIDAWIDPPSYTGVAPVYLPHGLAQSVSVPAGSQLEVRVHEAAARPHFSVAAGEAPRFTGAHREYGARYTITASGNVRVRADGRTLGEWRIQAIPDLAPQIAFSQPLSRTEHDAVKFAFTAGDDYGVVGVRALIHPILPKGKTGATIAVELPVSAQSRTLNETLFRDLTENPFAGLDVTIVLEARDAIGQRGLSKPVRFHLPARIFTDPLARALVEQRQILAVDASGARAKVEEMLDALSIDPEVFYKDRKAAWLAQRNVFHTLTGAKTPADIAHVEDMLWQTALSLDQAGLANAQDELRKLQQLLSQALAQGAPQDEIDALLQRYRQALSKYLQMLAQNAQHGGTPQAGQQALNISPEDLEKLLKAIQEAAQSGARQSAAQMLAMLQNLLENLHMTQGAGNGSGFADKALSDAIQGLSDLMGRQRELMDKTYRQSQGAGDPKDGGSKGLAQQQGKLKDDLDKARKGLAPGHKSPDSLNRAGHEMGDAQGELGADALEGAGQSQKNALDALRNGIGDLANQLMAEQNPGGGSGQAATDPLGRLRGNTFGDNVKVPDKSAMERARAILQELRRRAAEQGRPKRELDYIDRLLKEF